MYVTMRLDPKPLALCEPYTLDPSPPIQSTAYSSEAAHMPYRAQFNLQDERRPYALSRLDQSTAYFPWRHPYADVAPRAPPRSAPW